MDVSIKWGVLLVGVLRVRALLFGIYIRAPVFWKLPYGCGNEQDTIPDQTKEIRLKG